MTVCNDKDQYPRREDRLLEVPSAKNAQGLFSPGACIFVGNLSTKIPIEQLAEDLKAAFTEFGACHVKIKQDKKKNLPGAFVQFESSEDAIKALDSGSIILHDRCLRIERAKGRRTAALGFRSSANITLEEAQCALRERGTVEILFIQPYITTFNALSSIAKVTFAYVDDCRDAIKFFQKDTNYFMTLVEMDVGPMLSSPGGLPRSSPLIAPWPPRGRPFGRRVGSNGNVNYQQKLMSPNQQLSTNHKQRTYQHHLDHLNQRLIMPRYEAYAPGPVNLTAAHAQEVHHQQMAYNHGMAPPFYGCSMPPIPPMPTGPPHWMPQGPMYPNFDPRYPPGCPPGYPPGLIEPPMHNDSAPYMGHGYYSPPPPSPFIDNNFYGYQDLARYTPPVSCHDGSHPYPRIVNHRPNIYTNAMAMTPPSTVSHSASASSSSLEVVPAISLQDEDVAPVVSEQTEEEVALAEKKNRDDFQELLGKLLAMGIPEKAPKLIMVATSDEAPSPVLISDSRVPKYIPASGKTIEEYVRQMIPEFDLEGEENVMEVTDDLEEEYLAPPERSTTSVSV